MKKILITGNSGYIGSHLSKMLMDTMKYEVHGLDIRDPQYTLNRFYRQDIKSQFKIKEEFDCIIHLAALVNVGESEKMPTDYYMTNLIGTLNILQHIKTKNFIFASTGAAEKCESAYGVSKRATEDCVKEFCQVNKVPYTIFRFFNVIGSDGFKPTNPDGLMYNLLKSKELGYFTIFGNDYNTRDGTCERDYVHVNEICDALRTAIENPSNGLENLGHGVGHTVGEMLTMFKKVNNIQNSDLLTKIGPRRKGDIEVSVLGKVSPYMKNLYTIEQLLKVDV
jgi:UDP-glucose 4-epimerase